MLLCHWVAKCPIAVTHFLHNTNNVPFVSFAPFLPFCPSSTKVTRFSFCRPNLLIRLLCIYRRIHQADTDWDGSLSSYVESGKQQIALCGGLLCRYLFSLVSLILRFTADLTGFCVGGRRERGARAGSLRLPLGHLRPVQPGPSGELPQVTLTAS